MKIDVKKVAQLSNLTLSESEEIEFEKQLNDILSYIDQLNAVDTKNVQPTAQVTGLSNVLRNDNFSDECLPQELALNQAKEKHNNLYVVEKLVDTT